jgi:hypothetical protein
MANTQSTVSLQNILDIISQIVDIGAVLNTTGGYTNLTILNIANDVMNEFCAQPFPWKWNELILPQFYTNSWQQDYALQFGNVAGVTNLASLQRGIGIDINNAAAPMKPWRYVQCTREQTQATSSWNGPCPWGASPLFAANWMLNSQLYYGTWGAANVGTASLGNNPVAGSIYTQPLGAKSQPDNPITQIQDANGNLLVLITYGTEGSAAPVLPANSVPGLTVSGTGATTVWAVADPNGQGIRINPVPSQTGTVWQFNLVGQAKPVRFTSLSQTLAPLPDFYEPSFRQGCVAQAYRYSAIAKVRDKFSVEWPLWQKSLFLSREKSDKERESQRFVPAQTVMGAGGPRGGWWGPQWPFAGPPRGW